MIEITPDKLPLANARYAYKVLVSVDWPLCVLHNGKTYSFTRKEGTEMKTGLPSAEYAARTGRIERRLWLRIDGEITDD